MPKIPSKVLDFKSLVDPSNWEDYETFIQRIDTKMEHDIQKSQEKRMELREKLLKDPEIRSRIRPRQEDKKKWESLKIWAEKELFEGNVCAVDGTVSHFPMASGTRFRIGIVATSYKNKRVERVLYVSERELAEPSSGPIEHINNLMKGHRISNMLVRAIMMYAERDLALRRPERWKFVHGPLLPYELRTGLGVYRALDESLDLGQKLIEDKNVIAVIEDTTRLDWQSAGDILAMGEYLYVSDLKSQFELYLYGDDEKGISGAHFNRDDEKKFKWFIDSFAENILVGVFRAGYKPYVIEAHKDNFDKAIALVMQDSINQPMRGFPLLIDYADATCSGLLSGGEFQKQIMFKMAKISPETFGFETFARMTRRR